MRSFVSKTIFSVSVWFIAACALTAIAGVAPFLPSTKQEISRAVPVLVPQARGPAGIDGAPLGTVEFLNTRSCTDPACAAAMHLLWHPKHEPGTEVMFGTFPDGRKWTLKTK